MSDTPLNLYNYDGAEFDVRDTLPSRLRDYYDECFEFIGKYDTEREWETMLNVRTRQKRMRVGIWNEIRRIHKYGKKKFSISRAMDGITHPANFYRMCKNAEMCAYFFTRPIDHSVEARILLDDSLDNIRDIMKLPHISAKGHVNASVVNAQLKIFRMLQDRVMGQTIQRIQQHTVQETKESEPKTIAQIDAELAKLDKTTKPTLLEGEEAEILESSPEEE